MRAEWLRGVEKERKWEETENIYGRQKDIDESIGDAGKESRRFNHPSKGSLLKDPYRITGGGEIIGTTPIIGFRTT